MKRFTVFLLAIVLYSCRTTYITHSWKDARSEPARFKKLVVIALVGETEKEARTLMEKHLVQDLKTLGYNAVCSCEEYSPDFFKGLTEKGAIAKLREQGVDGILTIVLLNKTKEKIYVPGRYVKEFVFWDYYQNIYDRVYAKGYYTENTKYYWESNLYDMTANKLYYSIESRSFDPVSTTTLAHEYGKLILKKMARDKMLVRQDGSILKPM